MRSLPEQPVEIWGGMECTINRVGNNYFDQLAYSGHRDRNGDLDLFAGLGLKKIRYPILWEHHQPIESQAVNWEATDLKLAGLRDHGIGVIAGLVHHGCGPAFVNMRDDSFAGGLAAYAAKVAERYPWIDYYTPVNEPLTTARFCGLYGLWYPHRKDDTSFCRILINECKATALAMLSIRVFNPEAKLVQTDDLAKVHSTPFLSYQADFENERRWLSYDLLCGKVNLSHPLWGYLIEHGIGAQELDYFTGNPCPPDILGINYYLTSERYLDECTADYPLHTHGGNGRHAYADVEAVRVGRICPDGLRHLLEAAWERYHIPVAVTEVHLHCTRDEQMRWLNDSWKAVNNLASAGILVVAITPWALLGSFGWDRLLTQPDGNYEPGIFDISGGQPRPTILAAMLRAYSLNQVFEHPALNAPGWWQRIDRAAYGKDHFHTESVPSGKPLVITGHYTRELARICRTRCLYYVELRNDDQRMNHEVAWAFISVNDRLHISCSGRQDLDISLACDDLAHCLNAALDLFIDGETGIWEISAMGTLCKPLPDHASALHLLMG